MSSQMATLYNMVVGDMEVLEVESCIHDHHVYMTSGVQKQENFHVCLPCGFVGSDLFTMTVMFCITFNF